MNQWIRDLPIARKFALVFLLSLGMVALPAVLAVRGEYEQLSAASTEASGTPPAGALLKLLRLTQQHRGLSAMALAGHAEAGAQRQAKQAEVDQALQQAAGAVQALRQDKLAAQLQAAADEWKALSADVAAGRASGPQSFARHTALVGRQMQVLEDIVNATTLVLDPEAGTHHLIAAAFNHAPALTESLGQMRARGSAILTKGTASPEELVRLGALADLAQMQAASLQSALNHAMDADAPLKAQLQQQAAQAQAAARDALKLADEQIVKADSLALAPAAYFQALTATIDLQFALIDSSFKLLDQALAERVAHARNTLVLVAASIAGFALLTLLTIAAISRAIRQSMARALLVAQTVASGDLRSRIVVDSRDESGQLLQALKLMNDSLVRLVSQVRGSSDSIATAGAQIAGGNGDLSQRTEQQAASLQQTAASMEELTGTVRRNADHARQANQLATGASTAADQGAQLVNQVVQTMHDITASSRRISDIIGVIDGIAFQTNILALNAAVEAARAGEQGRGFAVVASEVRTLAQRSAGAAREIKQLIGQSSETVDSGARLVGEAGSAMQGIVGQVQRVAQLIENISQASHEQDTGIGEVSRAIHELDRVTQANAALVEESAAAAESLSHQATSLADMVRSFRLEPS